MSIAKLLKKWERIVYRSYLLYSRSKYAKHDLNRKLKNIDISPISSKDWQDIKSYYDTFAGGIRLDKKWFDLFGVFAQMSNTDNALLHTFIPHDIYYKYIDSYYSDARKCGFVDDKSLYGLYFNDVLQPRTVLAIEHVGGNALYLDENYRILSKRQAKDVIKSSEQLIVKESTCSSGGKGVWFYDDECSIDKILESKTPLIVQEIQNQHSALNKLHEHSLNTIRIISLILDDEVHILSSILRMGQGGAKVDNASSGGIFCGISNDGKLKKCAFDCNGNVYTQHPQGAKFEDVVIPNYDKCVEIVKSIAPRMSAFSGLCSWDLAINQNAEPVLIEANMTFGEVDFHQMCNGPIFGELTNRVLKEVFKK